MFKPRVSTLAHSNLFFTYIRCMPAALQQLKQLVTAIYKLDETDWQAFAAVWHPFTVKRKQIITVEGEVEKYLYFVVEGIQRVYYFDDQNREATLVFTYPPGFGGVLDSLMMQKPSRYFYESLTASVFLRTSFSQLNSLMLERPAIEYMIRQGITGALSGLLERLAELQCYSAEERFNKLQQRSAHIFGLVPHKYIASYLGMDATNFSKMLNKQKT